MKLISLSQSQVALVDDADYIWLNKSNWHANKTVHHHTFYARAVINGRIMRMHRLILGLKYGDERHCDHIDGNGLNNQRSNLRICTAQQNQRWRRSFKGSSKYKGVSYCQRNLKWRVGININKKMKFFGYFISELDAARKYDEAALEYFGEFARTNSPQIEAPK